MTTRLIIAYSMIAGLVAVGAIALWLAVFRDQWRRNRSRARFQRDMRERIAADGDSPFEEEH